MASIYRRGRQYWITYYEEGRRVRKRAGSTKRQAEATLRRLTGPAAKPSKATLSSVLDGYVRHLQVYAKPDSVQQAEIGQRHLLRHIGDVLAVDLTSRDLNRFIERRRSDKVTATTINRGLEILRAALRHAVEQETIKALPCRIRLLRTTRKRELPILGPTEVEQLLAHAHEPYRGVILIAAHTGFRLSEILHLTWVDVDWSAGRLIVTGKDGWKTKSYGERAVYVGDEVLAYLKKRRQKAPTGTAYIFPGSHGQPIRRDTACRNLKRIWKAAGLYQKGMPTSHWLRHSVCSRLLGAGVDIETTRRIMGHSDAATTLLYAHTSDQRLRNAARLLSGGSESITGQK